MSATNRSNVRVQDDVYITPQYTIDTLFKYLTAPKLLSSFLEPCATPGSHIVETVKAFFPDTKITTFDLQTGTNFLELDLTDAYWSLCITNPPYKHAQAFVDRILKTCLSSAILLRLNFLGSQHRHNWWQDKLPNTLIVLSRRPSFTLKGTDATEYAWFCWGPLFSHLPRLVIG